MNEIIALKELLDSRDARVIRQKELVKEYGTTVISFMVNIPGNVKYNLLSEKLHRYGMKAISSALSLTHTTTKYTNVMPLKTGIEGYLAVNNDAQHVKTIMSLLEDTHPLGRLFDIDVISKDGVQISRAELGFPVRRCLICNNPGIVCARAKTHPDEQVLEIMQQMLDEYMVMVGDSND